MRSVVHIGPSSGPGGMSSIINNLLAEMPEGWSGDCINTFSENGIISKIMAFISARNRAKDIVRRGLVDVAHIHVSHGFSWWRKLWFVRFFRRHGIPVIVHIHSGKFEKFCSGSSGSLVKEVLSDVGVQCVVLERRWLEILRPWIPSDTEVVNNFSDIRATSSKRNIGRKMKLLCLSRDKKIKGQKFSVRVLQDLRDNGVDATLTMTGQSKTSVDRMEGVRSLGWISEEEKIELIKKSDFLVHPSEYEGSSMSVIEAIRSGLPPIVSPCSNETVGIEELVLPIDSPHIWSERIRKISEVEEYNRILIRLQIEAKRFDPSNAKKNWGKIYDKCFRKSNHSN